MAWGIHAPTQGLLAAPTGEGDSPGCQVELGAAPKPPLLYGLIALALTVSLFSDFFPPKVF